MDTVTPALEIENLSYGYRSNWTYSSTQALKAVSLSIMPGEMFGFLGHNGAGKTTTIKCVLDLIRPRSGSIRIFGVESSRTEARREIGYLPEQPYFYDHLTVLEIVKLYAILAGVPARAASKSAIESLERLGLKDRLNSPMRSLSKGLTQRVAMAQAITAKPRLLILDEPFSGLDPQGRKEFRDLLSSLRNEGATILMSSHILGDVENLCDRVSILVSGELKLVLSLKDLRALSDQIFEILVSGDMQSAPELRSMATQCRETQTGLHLTIKGRDAAEQALRICLEKGARIESFQPAYRSLEDVFMETLQSSSSGGNR